MPKDYSTYYSYLVDRLAAQLQTHIAAVEELQKAVSFYDATRGSQASRERLEKALESLRSLREAIEESIGNLVNKAVHATPDALEDSIVLLEYFIEAAYKAEERALREALGRVDCSNDIEKLKSLRDKVLDTLNSIKALMKT